MKRRILILAAFALIAALASAQMVPTFSLVQSPTGFTTLGLFGEAADQYLNVLLFNQIDVPIFMLKYNPTTAVALVSDTAESFEVGMGAWWTKTMYAGGYYSMNGYMTGSPSVTETQNDTLIYSGLNIIGKSSALTSSVNYTDHVFQNPAGIFGIRIGKMDIGVYDSFTFRRDLQNATFNTSGTVSSTAITSVYDTTGAAEALLERTTTEYAVGYQTDTTLPVDYANIQNLLQAGISMPLMANMTLQGLVGVDISSDDDDSFYAGQTYHQVANAGYAAFTPTALFPGVTAAALADCADWSFGSVNNADTSFIIAPSLVATVSYDFPLFANSANAWGGLSYNGSFTARSGSLADAAGATQSITGTGSSSLGVQRTVVIDPLTGDNQVTTDTTRDYWIDTYTSDMSHTVGIPLALTVTPSPLFAFAIGVNPALTFGTQNHNTSGTTISTEVYDDGDGVAAATDPDDYTDVTTIVAQPFSNTTDTTKFQVGFTTGVKTFIVPKKLRLNLGAGTESLLFNRTVTGKTATALETTTVTHTELGVTTTTGTSVATSAVVNEFETSTTDAAVTTKMWYELGLTYYLNPNVQIDFAAKNDNVLNLASTTGTGGFFNLANYVIQLTIKLPPASQAAASK